MKVRVDCTKAKTILIKAFSDSESRIVSSKNGFLKSVFLGNHKTYKYVVLNALLAKATESTVHILALQTGAELKGAYDARSLCHGVIVPFERDYLNSALGGSNEPFLNKPARFTQLSKDNAVRRGPDKALLNSIIMELGSVQTKKEAYSLLSESLNIIRQIPTKSIKIDQDYYINNKSLLGMVEKITKESQEGETVVLCVAALLELLYEGNPRIKVLSHKTNQSGSSSKESSDIDVFQQDKLFLCLEVKDKLFSEHDILHAAKKAIEGNCDKLLFIYGAHATNADETISRFWKNHQNLESILGFYSVYDFAKSLIFLLPNRDIDLFISKLNEVAKLINIKDATYEYLNKIYKDNS